MRFSFRRFRTRILVFFIGLVGIVQVIAFIAVHEATTRSARSQIAYSLENVEIESRVFSRLTQERIHQVAEDAQILSMDFGFQSTIATADHGTILSALQSLRSRVDAHAVTLISLEYTVVADTLYPDAIDIPFVFPELIETGEEYGEASAIVPIDGNYYQMIINNISHKSQQPASSR